MPAGDHRRDAGRQEGAGRPERRGARERTVLARAAARPEAARADDRAGTGGRRWRARLLASARGGLAPDPRPTLLGAQDRAAACGHVLNKLPKSQQPKAKRALQQIWMAATRNDAEAAFDAFVETYAVKYDKAVDCLSKDRATLLALLRLPGRALDPPAHVQPHRKQLRHRAASNRARQGLPLQQNGARHDLQARTSGRKELAPLARLQPVAETHPRRKVQRRNRGRHTASSNRCRLTPHVTKIRR